MARHQEVAAHLNRVIKGAENPGACIDALFRNCGLDREEFGILWKRYIGQGEFAPGDLRKFLDALYNAQKNNGFASKWNEHVRLVVQGTVTKIDRKVGYCTAKLQSSSESFVIQARENAVTFRKLGMIEGQPIEFEIELNNAGELCGRNAVVSEELVYSKPAYEDDAKLLAQQHDLVCETWLTHKRECELEDMELAAQLAVSDQEQLDEHIRNRESLFRCALCNRAVANAGELVDDQWCQVCAPLFQEKEKERPASPQPYIPSW
eukprot:TRINITY_DN2242_c0_g1_i1.p1 TRINITY_DN2242_c0_g1~~TRINITY_DN2242_c0_g1_i1.p1  ORF type:complete len:305 (-),score=57.51 TRINITY_DN2242_c0_g1_i1:60-851(-)